MTSHHMTQDRTETGQRYTVHEAALLLGLSVEAVRKRAKRGSLTSIKEGGKVYILLDPDQAITKPDRINSWSHDRTGRDELVDSLQDQIEHLRRELDIRNEELRRRDHLLASTLERIPELEPLKAAEGAPEPRDSEPKANVAGDVRERHRSWFMRFFFRP